MNWQRHCVYWILPTLVVSGLIAMYFSNVPWLMSTLAPQINREYGLLESLQNLALLGCLAVIGWRLAQSETRMEEGFFLALLAGVVFMLLEETDYGLHYWRLIVDPDMGTRPAFSVHNYRQDAYLDVFKSGGDVLMALWFVIFPWVARRRQNEWLRFLRPSRLFGLSFIVAILLSDVAHYLEENHPPTPNYLGSTIGEFRELFTYYIWLLYFYILACKRTWPARQSVSE